MTCFIIYFSELILIHTSLETVTTVRFGIRQCRSTFGSY